jgi:hypothetical protein
MPQFDYIILGRRLCESCSRLRALKMTPVTVIARETAPGFRGIGRSAVVISSSYGSSDR